MGILAPPSAPAVRISWEWLKWKVWWRNTWPLMAGTCEFFTKLVPHCKVLIPDMEYVVAVQGDSLHLSPTGKTKASKIALSQVADIALCHLSHRTGVADKPCSTGCLMTCGRSWLAAWKGWFSATGNVAPQVGLNLNLLHSLQLNSKCLFLFSTL